MALDRQFLKRLLALGGPILLQNLFTVLGNSVTTFITGRLGDLPVAAAGLTNQLYFIQMLVQFGVSSGCSLFTAQFWGRKDTNSVLKTLGVSLFLGLSSGAIFMGIALFAPGQFLGIFTQNPDVVAIAKGLLSIVGFSFLFTPLIYTYAFVLRSTGHVRLPMVASITGVVLNIALGYGLVFGKLGMPKMGVNGAAAALTIARVTECAVLIFLVYRLKTPLAAPLGKIFAFDSKFIRKILQRVLPVMSNELIWGLGITAYNTIFARMGVESYAAVAIKDTIEGIVFVPFLSMTNACAIMVGHSIGSGRKEDAKGIVRQVLALDIFLAIGFGLLLLAGRRVVLGYFSITPQARENAIGLIAVLASVIWLRTANFVFFIGMMRSGGDTHFAWLMDVLSLWCIGVPLALLGTFALELPVHYVYLLVMAEEGVKFVISFLRFRSGRWIHDMGTA